MKYFIIFLCFLNTHNHLYSLDDCTPLDPVILDEAASSIYFSRLWNTSESLNHDAPTLPTSSTSEDSHSSSSSSSSSSTLSSESSQDVVSSEGEGAEPTPAQTSSPKKKRKKKKKTNHSGPRVDTDEAILEEASRAAAASSLTASAPAVTLALNLHEYARFFPFGGFKSHLGFPLRNKFKTISEIEKSYIDLPRSSVLQTFVFLSTTSKFEPLIDPITDKQDMVLYETSEESILSLGFGDRLVRIYGKPKEGAAAPHQNCFLELIIKNASRIYGVGEDGYEREEDPLEDDAEVRSVYIKLLNYLDEIPAFEEVSPELVRSKIASERRSLSESRTLYYLAVREKASENVFLVAVRNKPKFRLDIIQHSAKPEDDAAALEKFKSYFKAMPCLELPSPVDRLRRRI